MAPIFAAGVAVVAVVVAGAVVGDVAVAGVAVGDAVADYQWEPHLASFH